MKRILTENIGLKILSILAAFVLWLVVVNVDDPVINRTYSGIPVEILNQNAITDEGMCYEVLGGTDTISVVVSAKRSVLDDMSRDYIKATADMKQLTSGNMIPIEVKTTRFSDAIESVSSRTANVQLHLEDIVERKVPLEIQVSGEVGDGYLLSTVTPKFNEITISGPESEVLEVEKAVGTVDVDGLTADELVIIPIDLFTENDVYFGGDNVTLSSNSVSVKVVIWGTKEIPITCGVSGTPAEGYSVTGTTQIEPASVVITGRSAYLESMSSIVIPQDKVSVSGATENVAQAVDISKLLPDGISIADSNFDGEVVVTATIEKNDKKMVEIPTANITVTNVPEGYKVTIVDIGDVLPVEIQGKGDTYDRFDGSLAIGVIDATALMPRNMTEATGTIHVGPNDGQVIFTFPTGVREVAPVYMQVIVELSAE